eukprot:6184440-Pleurochrysis_carterae.AAC.4
MALSHNFCLAGREGDSGLLLGRPRYGGLIVGENKAGGRVACGPIGVGIPDKVVGRRVLIAQAHGLMMVKVHENASRGIHERLSGATHGPTQEADGA